MAFVLTFNLKTDRQGSTPPCIYGNHPALGGGSAASAIPMQETKTLYKYTLSVTMDTPIPENTIWYTYVFKTQFNGVVQETIPIRFLPKVCSDCTVRDTFNTMNNISGFVLRFRVRYQTHFGQQLFVAGNLPELGEWAKEGAIQLFHTGVDDIWAGDVNVALSSEPRTIEYKYFVSSGPYDVKWEPEDNHILNLGAVSSPSYMEINDKFRWSDPLQDAFSRSVFVDVINRRKCSDKCLEVDVNNAEPGRVQLCISVYCPHVRSEQKLVVTGSCPELGNWNPLNGLSLSDANFPRWSGCISVDKATLPFEYKYVIVGHDDELIWESESNRYSGEVTLKYLDPAFPSTLMIADWYVCPNRDYFRGLGVYAPVFSLRTRESCGIGNYTDIKQLADVCSSIGARMIQLLPINDTTDKGEWDDSYPYRQVSCFALHPVYINVLGILPELPSPLYNKILEKKAQFEALPSIDYPAVYAFKMEVLDEIFQLVRPLLATDSNFKAFVKDNAEWLKPYALFCHLRDKFGTQEFRTWPEHSSITPGEITALASKHAGELLFTYWLQYVCDNQFKDAHKYAASKRVALKGDLPIGVHINSVECWVWPDQFRLHECAGAPPDQFSSDGQNWGFPTYDWPQMATTDFHWWRLRLSRMAELYDALRVDHVLGFFRIWEIPRETTVRGMLGHFFPANPLSREELYQRGLNDIDRYTKPYIRWHTLQQKFGAEAARIAKEYLEPRNWDANDDWFDFKEEYDNERKVDDYVSSLDSLSADAKKHLRCCLFELLSNVLLIEDEDRPGFYHVRTEIKTEHIESTPNGPVMYCNPSWLELPEPQRSIFQDLYVDFTYKRQTGMWVSKAAPKLSLLKNSTRMLICAEDLGQISDGIINALEREAMLSLRVQRMSKDPSVKFDEVRKFPYLSVCCPSTHDCSSIRGWWEEDRSVIRDFWRSELWRLDEPPTKCEPWIQEMIFKQHLWSNSMWAIFLLQDITGCESHLRLQTPTEEQINIPADPKHHWGYRYPYLLEDLCNDSKFTKHIKQLVHDSGRE